MIDNNIISIFFASLIQGFTEFLPISSSGHLVLFNYFFSQQKDSLDFEIILHFGTILSIIVYYKNDIFEIIFQLMKGRHFGKKNSSGSSAFFRPHFCNSHEYHH